MASGRPAPLPGPGTYARHNAVDMPALLPDGSPSEDSVSPFISQRRMAPPGAAFCVGPALTDEQRSAAGERGARKGSRNESRRTSSRWPSSCS